MKTITTHEAKTHLSRYLSEVEAGKQFIISRGKKPVARLVPVEHDRKRRRPKVGEIKGKPFDFSEAALVPMKRQELKKWGL